MSKKLEGNGIYESSRFIIPQHKEAAVKQMQEINRRKRPTLDEQQWEEVERVLSESIRERVPVTIHVFGPFENRQVTGTVAKFDVYNKAIKVIFDDDWDWIKFEDVISAEV